MTLRQKVMMEVIGWAGATASLSAFSLNSLNLISSQSVQYLLLNIFGCFFLIMYALTKKAHASWVLNTIWLIITVIALVRIQLAN